MDFMSTMDVFATQKEIRKVERDEKLQFYKLKAANRNFYDFISSDTKENYSSDNNSDDLKK